MSRSNACLTLLARADCDREKLGANRKGVRRRRYTHWQRHAPQRAAVKSVALLKIAKPRNIWRDSEARPRWGVSATVCLSSDPDLGVIREESRTVRFVPNSGQFRRASTRRYGGSLTRHQGKFASKNVCSQQWQEMLRLRRRHSPGQRHLDSPGCPLQSGSRIIRSCQQQHAGVQQVSRHLSEAETLHP